MLTIDLGFKEHYDSENNEFIYEQGGVVRFEYSLRMVYEWESKWRKPFLKGEATGEEIVDFYKRMALDPMDERFLTKEVMNQLGAYIGDPNTATTFSSNQTGQNGNNNSQKSKVYTAEEIYALMFTAGVPLVFEDRNLNRLLVVLKIMSSYNNPPKKMSKSDIYKQNAQLNAARKKKMNTRG